jgi:hypothetical protein
MTAAEVLSEARHMGVVLSVGEGGKLRWRCLGGLPVDLRELLVAHKAELLSLLTCTTQDTTDKTPADLPEPWYERWQERSAIMQYDASMSPEQANALALEDIREQMARTEATG